MKNKGFTLIELLAVIIILAIIALIAVPVIINVIGDAKESSNERSLELYESAVEVAAANFKSNNIGTNIVGVYDVQDDGKTLVNEKDSTIVIRVDFKGKILYKRVVLYPDHSIYLTDAEGETQKESYGTLKGDVNLDGELDEYDIVVIRKVVSNKYNEIQSAYLSGKTMTDEIKEQIIAMSDINEDGKIDTKDVEILKNIVTYKHDITFDNKIDEMDYFLFTRILAGTNNETVAQYLPEGTVVNEELMNEIYSRMDITGDERISLDDLSMMNIFADAATGKKVHDLKDPYKVDDLEDDD